MINVKLSEGSGSFCSEFGVEGFLEVLEPVCDAAVGGNVGSVDELGRLWLLAEADSVLGLLENTVVVELPDVALLAENFVEFSLSSFSASFNHWEVLIKIHKSLELLK